jgi:hypothetical protein
MAPRITFETLRPELPRFWYCIRGDSEEPFAAAIVDEYIGCLEYKEEVGEKRELPGTESSAICDETVDITAREALFRRGSFRIRNGSFVRVRFRSQEAVNPDVARLCARVTSTF